MTSAALLGIQDNGHSWRGALLVPIPDNIPRQVEALETTKEVNDFVDTSVKKIYQALTNSANNKRLPQGARSALNVLVSGFKETLVDDTFTPDDEDKIFDAEVLEAKLEDLLHFLEDLYDWADYHRIIIKPN